MAMENEADRDWREGISMKRRWKCMLDSNLMCDAIFIFQNGVQIKAHKFILCSASSAFEKIFDDRSNEGKPIGTYLINDFNVDTFRVLLEHLYSSEPAIQFENVADLLIASQKFMIQPITDQCREFLISHIDTDHACLVFGIAFTNSMTESETKALNSILKNGNKCLKSDFFLSLPTKSLPSIVKPDKLDCKEETVYLRLMEWSKLMCKKESVEATDQNIKLYLGETFDYIRFPLMNIDFFTTNVANKTLLSEGEKLKVYQQISSTGQFSVNRRMRKANHILRCKADLVANGLTDLNVTAKFSASGPGLLTSVLLFGSKDYEGSHTVEITITKGEKVYVTSDKTLESMAGQEIYEIFLDKPVEVVKHTKYGINLKMEGPATFRGKSYSIRPTGKDGYSVDFVFEDPKRDKETTQIAGLVLERNPYHFFPTLNYP